MPHKSFVPDSAPEKREPITFEIGGFRESTGEAWKEAFTCLPEAPSGVLDDLATSTLLDDQGNRKYNAPSLMAFCEGVLIDADVARFRAITHDKDRIVKIELLGEVMMYLAEQLTNRPTER